MLLAVEPVHHLVAVRHFAAVVHGGALLLGAGVGVSLLHLLLDLVAGIAARRRSGHRGQGLAAAAANLVAEQAAHHGADTRRSEEHTSELQSLTNLVCRLVLEKN